jgi:AraC-like DNA-binding protein
MTRPAMTGIGMSRSVFAQRFKSVVGEAPMEYLTRCRLHQATQLLLESNMSIGQIANMIGYESDASFNKAFKRRLGVSPGAYRLQSTPVARPID